MPGQVSVLKIMDVAGREEAEGATAGSSTSQELMQSVLGGLRVSDPDTDRLRRLRADAVQLTLRELDRYGRRIRRGRLRTPRAAVIVEIHTLEKFRTAD